MSNIMNDALDEQLDKEIQLETAARTSFATALNKEKLVDILREAVDASSCLDFLSGRHRRHISAFRPILELDMDVVAAQEKYPDLSADLVDFANDDTIRNARTEVVNREVMNTIVNFFTAAFKYVLEDNIPAHYAEYSERVYEILGDRDTKELRNKLIDIFKVKDKDGNITERTGFTFSIINAVALPEDYKDDNSVSIEIAY